MKKIIFFSLSAMLILAVALSGCGGGSGSGGTGGGDNNGGGGTGDGGNNGGGGVITVTTVAGGGPDGQSFGDVDSNTGSGARFRGPWGIAIANGIIYIIDSSNYKIKKIEPASGYKVTTIAGNGMDVSSDNPKGILASFACPRGIAIAANGNIYVTESIASHKIRMITAIANYPVSTIAGSGTAGHTDDATGTSATFNYPAGITLAGDDLYVAEAGPLLRKIGLTSPYRVDSIGSLGGYALYDPAGVIVANGAFYASNNSIYNQIVKIVPSTTSPGGYEAIILAGGGSNGQTSGSKDGIGTEALFYQPTAMAMDSNGNIYVVDSGNHKIRKINPATGQVTTIAGGGSDGKTPGSKDGTGAEALFNRPCGIAIAADGSLYVTDSDNNKIRKISFK